MGALDEQYVCLKLLLRGVWLTLLKAFIGVRYSIEAYVVLPHAPFCFPNTSQRKYNGLALIFVGWMHETGAVLALNEQRVRL